MFHCALFRFHELESTDNGHQILEGDHLEDALRTWSQFADESVNEAAVAHLQQELCRCKQRRDELRSTHDKLVVHHTALADQISQLANVSTASKIELQHTAEQIQVDNSNVSIQHILCVN